MMRERMRLVLSVAVLAAATVISYGPALRADFVWDDDAYVTLNRDLRDQAGLWRIWFDTRASPQYYPLVFTSFWIEFQLWGLHPLGYHAVNVLLHIVAALLLWRV